MHIPLYSPDRLSQPGPDFGDVENSFASSIVELAKEHHPTVVTGALSVKIAGEPLPANTKANGRCFIIESDAGAFALKNVLNETILQTLDAQISLMTELARLQLPVPEAFRTESGSFVFRDGEEQVWYLMENIRGRYFNGSSDTAASAGEALAELHSQLSTFSNASLQRTRPDYFTPEEHQTWERLDRRRDDWSAMFGTDVAAWLAGDWSKLRRKWDQLLGEVSTINQAPKQLGHYDLHPHNVLCHEHHVTGLIDFDALYVLPKYTAIAFSAFKLLRQCGVHYKRSGGDPIPAMNALVASLRSGVQDKLHNQELRLYAQAEIMRRFLSVARYGLNGQAISWNGIQTHFASLFEVERMYSGPDSAIR